VSLLNGTMLPDDEYLHASQMYDHVRSVSFGGRIHIFTVELPKIETLARSKTVREMTPAERWAAYFFYNADRSAFARELIGEITKEEEAIEMASELVHEYTADEKRYYHLLSEMKYELDHFNRMAGAEERGVQIGEERGRAAERVKWQGVVADKEAEIADKEAEIARLRAQLERRS
jgi:hypothetical protein